jgi:hypothetical protein
LEDRLRDIDQIDFVVVRHMPKTRGGPYIRISTRFQGDLYQPFPLTSIRLGGFLSVPLHSCPPALLRNT